MAVSISDEEKWQALVSCSSEYDGLFFYGVKTTGIFCRPSCRAKTPVRENVVFFADAVQALRQGFRPCKKCRPDQAAFQPDLDLVLQAKEFIRREYKTANLREAARHLCISPSHLARLFRQHLNISVSKYIAMQRITHAQQLLAQTDMSCTDIAYTVGFNSLSAFYAAFSRQTGCSPNQYRNETE